MRVAIIVGLASLAVMAIGVLLVGARPGTTPDEVAGAEAGAGVDLVGEESPSALARVPALLGEVAWSIVDDQGRPVGGAEVEIDGAVHGSGPGGGGSCKVSKERMDAVARHPDHESWSGQLTLGPNTIVLPRTVNACIKAVEDESGAAVEGVQVALSLEALDLEGARKLPIRERTGPDGKARFRGVPAGSYRIYAEHESLVFSHEAQDLDASFDRPSLLCKVPGGDVEIRMSHPWVIGYVIKDDPKVLLKIKGSGTHMHKPSNTAGRGRLTEIEKALGARFPNARFSTYVRDPHAPGVSLTAQVATRPGHGFVVIVQAIGRAEMQVPVSPVRLDQFIEPIVIDAMSAPASDLFASVKVSLRGDSGIAIDGVKFWLESRRPDLFVGPQLLSGQAVLVPVGEYALRSREKIVDSFAQALGWFQLQKGQQSELKVNGDTPWIRASFRVEDAPGASGTLLIRHAGGRGEAFTQFNSKFAYELLMPPGQVEVIVVVQPSGADRLAWGFLSTVVGPEAKGPFAIQVVEGPRDEIEAQVKAKTKH